MTVAIQCILTAAQSLASQDYYKKSRMTIFGLAGVLFCENEQAQTKWIFKAIVGNRVTTDYHFMHIVFLFFSVSFNESIVFHALLKRLPGIVGLSQAEVSKTY